MQGEIHTENKQYFHGLDVVRFIAAFMIVIDHGYFVWQGALGQQDVPATNVVQKYLINFVHNFGFGVDIFFLISGFLISYLLQEEKVKYGKIDIKNFYIRRILRIWPMYYLLIIIGIILPRYSHSGDIHLIPNLFFFGNFDTMYHGWSNTGTNHLWSICIEEHFYLVFPFLAAFLSSDKLKKALLLLITGAIVFRILTLINVQDSWMRLSLHTFSRVDTILLGAYLGILYQEGTIKVVNTSRFFVGILSFVLVFLLCTDDIGLFTNAFLVGLRKYSYVGIVAILVGTYLFHPQAASWSKKTPLHYLGKASYSIYMIHPIIIEVFAFVFKRFHIHSTYLFLITISALTIVLSICTYEGIEKPILRLKKRFEK